MEVIIIGGGASGLTAAILAARDGKNVTVLEANERVAKKLLMTGGGRCNLANVNIDKNVFNHPDFVDNLFNSVNFDKFKEFLKSIGLFIGFPDEEGRIYPITYSANSVADALRLTADRLKVKVVCSQKATKIQKVKDKYKVFTKDAVFSGDRIVVSVGGNSQAADNMLSNLINSDYLTSFCPALTPIKVNNPPKMLNGLRMRCSVALFKDGKSFCAQRGEVQFRDFGLSGICVFNLSSIIARDRVAGKKYEYTLSVDALPDFELNDLERILADRTKEGYTHSELFVGLLPNKAAEYIVKNTGNTRPSDLAFGAKNMKFYGAQLTDYSLSQVTCGGVDINYLDKNLSLPDGVRVCGEAIDVDAFCGGYNLYFAFVSGITVAAGLDK
jgi:predicted Rossmann fold flavoprotein